MLISVLRADMFRARRSPSLILAPVVVLALSAYSCFSLFAGASGIVTPSFILLSPDSSSVVSNSIPSITESIGSLGISGGFLPIVSSLVVALFLARGLKSGHYAGIISAGASRTTLVLEALSISIVSSAVLLVACAVPYFVGYVLSGACLLSSDALGALPVWLVLASFHIFFYSFLSGCVTLVAQRRAAGIASAAIVSSGVLEMALVALLQPALASSSALATLVLLLPDSIAAAMCQAPVALFEGYVGPFSLLFIAAVAYSLLTIVVGAVSSILCRKISIL